MPTLRFDRARYFAFGLVSVFNVAGLLLHGLNLSTGGARGLLRGSEATLPAVLVISAICLLVAAMAAVKRGRDLGWPALVTLAACVVLTGLGPAVLLLVLYLAFAREKPAAQRFGPSPETAGPVTWLLMLINAVWPWMAVLVLGQVG
jgi:uncharacterized membrane protein YhaH (DUF805 family)